MTRWFTVLILVSSSLCAAEPAKPIAPPDLVFEERDGLVAVEAEHFSKQTLTDIRAWYLFTKTQTPVLKPDADPVHLAGASAGAYLEILPDTRRNHGEKLIHGENFSNTPGKLAVLHYKVHFNTPGKYYVWARVHSTGTEDNGLHVGLNGEWPASGQRMQWTAKRAWTWNSKQRTEKVHGGVKGLLFLEIEKPGLHEIAFSMREDGFEFDKWLMTTDKGFAVDGVGPNSRVKSGKLPKPFPFVKPVATTPVPVPKAKPDAGAAAKIRPSMHLADFPERNQVYVDDSKWFAVNPASHKSGRAAGQWPFRGGIFDLTLHAVGEDDGRSTYELFVDGKKTGSFTAPLADATTAVGSAFNKQFSGVRLKANSKVEVRSSVGSKNGEGSSRARWARIGVKPADGKALGARLRGTARPVAAAPVSPPRPPPAFTGDRFGPRQSDGDLSVIISGEKTVWHALTLTLDGPFAHEKDNAPNPFRDIRVEVDFKHTDGTVYRVPGYFAADGNAAETSAESGTKWRAHFSPDRPGTWTYVMRLQIAGVRRVWGPGPIKGTFDVAACAPDDSRARGRLQYVGKHYLQYAGSKEFFLKAGADAPETFLAYADFDGTVALRPSKAPLKTWSPHVRDWRPGDPSWKGGKGKGMIGAINYLAGKGCNVFSFLPYNAGGDGDNVWPHISHGDKLHFDCSKLDQWGIVFEHATELGMFLHFKLQETENDDNRRGKSGNKVVPAALDGGDLGPERRLYLRELIARYGHHLALNWNLGEENTQSLKQQRDMADFIAKTDAYDHLIVVHTYPDQQDKIYPSLIQDSALRGASLQNSNVADCHKQVLKWRRVSAAAKRPWIVSFDEPGNASEGMPADPGYPGMPDNFSSPSIHQVRKQALWGTLMAGGTGVEYYFGYKLPQNDLVCEDWRSRDRSWDYCRIALNFFRDHKVPVADMENANALVGNPANGSSKYCLAKPNHLYLVYLANGGACEIDLSRAKGAYNVHWFNPRTGGKLMPGGVKSITGGGVRSLGSDRKTDDWVCVLRRT